MPFLQVKQEKLSFDEEAVRVECEVQHFVQALKEVLAQKQVSLVEDQMKSLATKFEVVNDELSSTCSSNVGCAVIESGQDESE